MNALKPAAWVISALVLGAARGEARELDLWAHGPDPLHEKYEHLFDASFPRRGFDPFDRLRPFDDVREFNRRFDLRTAGIWTRVDEAGDHVVLVVRLPDSAGQALDVAVEQRDVSIRPADPAPEQVSAWRFRGARAAESRIPIPAAADAATAKVSREGDTIRILFTRAN